MDIRQVPFPKFALSYNGKDISRGLEPYLISLTFEDSVEGEASSVEIEVQNVDQLFSNGWYPEKTAKLNLVIGDMKCGNFILDEIELKGPPDTMVIKALSNAIAVKALKTKRSRAHHGKSLSEIANSVATANGLKLVGSVPNIPIDHSTQKQETDLKFLRRKAWDFGIIFSVRDDKLVFTYLPDLEKKSAPLSLDKTELLTYDMKDKTDKTYKGAVVRSHNPKNRTVYAGSSNIVTLDNADDVSYTQIVGADRLVVHKRAENQQQAEAMADAHFYRANSWQQSGTIESIGNALAVAGNNIELTGLGTVMSGKYNLAKVTHTVNRADSWRFNADVKRVAVVSKIKQRGKSTVQPNTTNKVLTLQNNDGIKYTQIVPVDNALSGK